MALDWSLHNGIYMGEGSGYVGVTLRKQVRFGKRNFLVVVYGAFNAYGLVGPEKNGIAIFDEDSRRLVLDEHCIQGSGYFGPEAAQKAEFARLTEMGWEEFNEFVLSHPRSRLAVL